MDASIVAGRTGAGVGERVVDAALCVVVVTYNSARVLSGLLDSLPSGLEGVRTTRVIVVDNDSGDGSAELAEVHAVQPRVIRMGRNAGYAAGINAATRTLPPDWHVLVLNPDIRLFPSCAKVLVEAMADPLAGVVVPTVLNEDGTLALSLRREPSLSTGWSDALVGTKLAARFGLGEIVSDSERYAGGGPIEWATGAILAISARARAAVGEWDESFFLYSEEVDYMQRVRRQGLRVGYVPEGRAIHFGGEYHENTFLSWLMTRNRIRYFRRHHGALATGLFRLSIIVGETMRFALGPGHRAALRAALAP